MVARIWSLFRLARRKASRGDQQERVSIMQCPLYNTAHLGITLRAYGDGRYRQFMRSASIFMSQLSFRSDFLLYCDNGVHDLLRFRHNKKKNIWLLLGKGNALRITVLVAIWYWQKLLQFQTLPEMSQLLVKNLSFFQPQTRQEFPLRSSRNYPVVSQLIFHSHSHRHCGHCQSSCL